MEKSKGETFIGFAVKAGKCKIGTNAVATLKSAKLIIACKSASENALKESKKFSKKFGCPLLITAQKTLAEMVYKDNAKIMAITDAALAKAIYEHKDKDFIESL